jgi:hypothetical protein
MEIQPLSRTGVAQALHETLSEDVEEIGYPCLGFPVDGIPVLSRHFIRNRSQKEGG